MKKEKGLEECGVIIAVVWLIGLTLAWGILEWNHIQTDAEILDEDYKLLHRVELLER